MRLTIGKRLGLGFGLIVVIMLGTAAITVSYGLRTKAGVDELDRLSADAALGGEIMKDVLSLRMKAKDYLIARDDSIVTAFAKVHEETEKKLKEAGRFTNPERREIISSVTTKVAEYEKAFGDVVEAIHAREAAVEERMTPAASGALAALEKLKHDAAANPGSGMLETATNSLQALMAERIDVLKGLQHMNSDEMIAAVEKVHASAQELDEAARVAKGETLRRDATEAAQAMRVYGEAATEVAGFVAKRNDVVKHHLDVVGPAIAELGESLQHSFDKAVDEAGQSAETAVGTLKTVIVGSALVAMFLAVGLSVIITRSVVRPLAALQGKLASSDGDLTIRVDESRSDELGDLGKWINTFIEKIHDVVVQVSMASSEVAAASTQIAASSEEMAAGINQQSQQAQQISSAVEEMSASVVEVARKSGEASDSATSSGKSARDGGVVVEQSVQSMESIRAAVESGAQAVTSLGKRGEQIGAIVDVINDIADQTNLLALNAAIEAARAGEHGRGFAVVADEVRKLADRTTKATEEIASSIREIQRETTMAVERMTSGTQEVELGSQRARQAGEALKTIVTGAESVAEMVHSIAAAAEQQSAASEQIARSIESISAVSRESSSAASQSAQAAGGLSAKAEQLRTLVGQFKIDSSRGVTSATGSDSGSAAPFGAAGKSAKKFRATVGIPKHTSA